MRDNLKSFPKETLKERLLQEGVNEEDFRDSLVEALHRKNAAGEKIPLPRFIGGVFMLLGGLAVLLGILFLGQRWINGRAKSNNDGAVGGAAFTGRDGFTVGLPSGYVAFDMAQGPKGEVEDVYFCKKGTTPDVLLDRGLYGQLGIVELRVMRRGALAAESLEAMIDPILERSSKQGVRYQITNLKISALDGVEISFGPPLPHVEAYVLGGDSVYSFWAGDDGEVFQQILSSLRDRNSED